MLTAIIAFLQKTSADAPPILFAVIGMPVFRDGLPLSLPGLTILVAPRVQRYPVEPGPSDQRSL